MAFDNISPIFLVQNPAFGSLLLWNFCRSFEKEKADDTPPLTSFFLVLPLILHGPTLRTINSTQLSSGLSKLTSKLSERFLLSIHKRTIIMRDITLQSIAVGISAKMICVDYNTALVKANIIDDLPHLPEKLKLHMSSTEKLGRWFAQISLGQTFSFLRVIP